MPQNYNAFKVMIEKSPEQFLARILPGAELIEVLNIELPRESLDVDALLRVRYHGKEYILHLEVQTDADATMPARILQYLSVIWLRDRLPVLPVVIWLFPVSVPSWRARQCHQLSGHVRHSAVWARCSPRLFQGECDVRYLHHPIRVVSRDFATREA